jgi:hypothetical protein
MCDYLLKLCGAQIMWEKINKSSHFDNSYTIAFYSIIQIVVIRFEDKLNIIFLKVWLLCLTAVSSLVSYIYALYKSNELSILSDSLKNLENDIFLDKNNNY